MDKIDLAALYRPAALAAWKLPASVSLDPVRGEFRAPRLNWSDLPERDTQGRQTPMWFICCDVLVIGRDVILDRPCFIFARRIEVKKGASLILDRVEAQAADLTVFVQEVADAASGERAALTISAVARAAGSKEAAQTDHALQPLPKTYATGLKWGAADPAPKDMPAASIDPDYLAIGEPLRLSLMTTFQIATLLSTDHPRLSIAQSQWIASLADAASETREIAGQAAAMAGTLTSMLNIQSGALLVPRLDAELYASASKALMDVLRDRNNRWETLQTRLQSDANWISDAKAVLAEQSNQRGLQEKLEKQALQARDQALEARNVAAAQVVCEQLKIRDCERDFELGIKRWQEAAIRGEVFNILKGAFDILTSIPAIVAGAPHMAVLPAVQTAAGVANALLTGALGVADTLSRTLSRNSAHAASAPSGAPARDPNNDDDPIPSRPTRAATDSILLPIDGYASDDDEDDILLPADDDDDDDTVSSSPSSTAPSGTAPSSTAPSGTAPSGTALSSTAPSGTAPSSTAPSTTASTGGTGLGGAATTGTGIAGAGTAMPGASGGSGSGQAGAGATKTPKSKEELEKIQEKMLGGLKSAGAGAKGIFDAAMNIAAIAARARAMEQSSQLVLKKIGTTVDKAFSSNILRGLDTVTGGQQEWETLAVTIEDTFDRFQDGLLKSIDGGSDYRLAFRRLVICGRSLSQARLAVAKANLQLAELMLRRQAAERSVQIAQTRLEEIEDKAAAAETLAQFVFNTTLDSKRSVYLAMEAYQRAFRYFTLSDDAPPLPRITDTVDAFSKAVADISTKVLARERLSPAPQTMLERIFELTAPEILTDLKSNGSTSWTLATSDSAFQGFGRVRVDRVRVLADGIKPGAEVEIRIRTSGVYEDKVPKGNVRMFVSEPLSKTFVYRGDWIGGDVGIQIDGDVARRYQDDFFSPTPFTTWTLSINGRGGSKIDLSALTGLKFYFRGEITEGARA